MKRPFELEVISDEEIGREGGFLYLRRVRLKNLRPDGTRSREWVCDFVERPKGVDAVVLVLWRPGADGATEVLLREGLRPALHYGRKAARVPLPDARPYFFFTEVVAGIIEQGEVGEEAIRRRAVDEAWEEAGYRIAPEAVELLGAGSFPSPGMTAEKFWLAAARVEGAEGAVIEGDGSPMEEAATIRWVALEEAIAQCETGEIEDAKTELALRRLAGRLARR
ncbi:MAG: NUDIX hydrolase [Myxococcales bacterium]|nr:NUDIX hydrolase [Myxococcales bacterium]